MNYLFDLNTDDRLRHEIMGIEMDYSGGYRSFDKLTLETLNKLIENGFVNLLDSQNNAPNIRDFASFMEKFLAEDVTAHGYLISPERTDYRITIVGLEASSSNKDFINDFAVQFRKADELDCRDGCHIAGTTKSGREGENK